MQTSNTVWLDIKTSATSRLPSTRSVKSVRVWKVHVVNLQWVSGHHVCCCLWVMFQLLLLNSMEDFQLWDSALSPVVLLYVRKRDLGQHPDQEHSWHRHCHLLASEPDLPTAGGALTSGLLWLRLPSAASLNAGGSSHTLKTSCVYKPANYHKKMSFRLLTLLLNTYCIHLIFSFVDIFTEFVSGYIKIAN